MLYLKKPNESWSCSDTVFSSPIQNPALEHCLFVDTRVQKYVYTVYIIINSCLLLYECHVVDMLFMDFGHLCSQKSIINLLYSFSGLSF